MTEIDFDTVVPKFDAILARGLSHGVGKRDGQMCVEAAICAALDLPHGDNPLCVAAAVRSYKIRLNDSRWSSPQARANGLRDLGIAQLGSKGVVNDQLFARRIAELTIRRLLPDLLRRWPDADVQAAADRCARDGTADAARAARDAMCGIRDRAAAAADYAAADAATYAAYAAYAADAADAANAATYAAYAADAATYAAYAADAANAADAATYAADAKKMPDPDYFLRLSASLALDVLRELQSPGIVWLDAQQERSPNNGK